MGISVAMKGYKGKIVGSAYSNTKLEIKGRFHFQGPQTVGDEGGAPEWIYELFKLNPDIEAIAINRENSGVVYTPIKE